MAVQLLPLMWTGPITTRMGDIGANVVKHIPFYGHWNPSGNVYAYPGYSIPQNTNPRLGPVPMPDNFQKDCCLCA